MLLLPFILLSLLEIFTWSKLDAHSLRLDLHGLAVHVEGFEGLVFDDSLLILRIEYELLVAVFGYVLGVVASVEFVAV